LIPQCQHHYPALLKKQRKNDEKRSQTITSEPQDTNVPGKKGKGKDKISQKETAERNVGTKRAAKAAKAEARRPQPQSARRSIRLSAKMHEVKEGTEIDDDTQGDDQYLYHLRRANYAYLSCI
jgi:hypothetical protein